MNNDKTKLIIILSSICLFWVVAVLLFAYIVSNFDYQKAFIKELARNHQIEISPSSVMRISDLKGNSIIGIVMEEIKPNNVKLIVEAPAGRFELMSDQIEFNLSDGKLHQYNNKGEGWTTNFNTFDFSVSTKYSFKNKCITIFKSIKSKFRIKPAV